MALSLQQRLTNQEVIAVGLRVAAFKIVDEYSHKKKFTQKGLGESRQEMLVKLLELFDNQFSQARASKNFHDRTLELAEDVEGVKPMRKLERILKWVLGISVGVAAVGVAGIGVVVGGVLIFSVPFGGLLLGGTIAAGSVALAGAGIAIVAGAAKSKIDYVAEGKITSRMGEVLIYTMIALSKEILIEDLQEHHILAYTAGMTQKLERPEVGIPRLSVLSPVTSTSPVTPKTLDSFMDMVNLDPPPEPDETGGKEVNPWVALQHADSVLVVKTLHSPPQGPPPRPLTPG